MKKKAAFYSAVLTMACMGLLVAALAAVSAGVQTIYVNGPAANSADVVDCGSTIKPCKTIQYAINKATGAGTVINVAKGTYTGNLTIDKPKISLVGQGGVAYTLIVAKTNTLPAIKLYGAQLISISGFTVRGGGEAAIWAGMSSLELKSSTVEKSAGKGIVLAGSSVGQLTGVTVRSNPRVGIHVSSNSFLRTYPSVTVTANSGGGIEIRKNGSAELEKCNITANGGLGVNVNMSSSCSLTGCLVKNNAREGVWVQETSSVELQGNNISYNKQSGVNVAQASCAFLQGGNVISFNGDLTKPLAWRCGIQANFRSQVTMPPNSAAILDQISNNLGCGIFLGSNSNLFMARGIINNNHDDGVNLFFNSSASFGEGNPIVVSPNVRITNNGGFGINCTDGTGDSKYAGTPFFGSPQSNKKGATNGRHTFY